MVMSAREMLSGLPIRMAKGGDTRDATLLAAEQKYLANPDKFSGPELYNKLLANNVSVDDLLAAGVAQSTIDSIFNAPEVITDFQTPTNLTSSLAGLDASASEAAINRATGLVDRLQASGGGIDDAERLRLQKAATQYGVTFADLQNAGIDPNILYNTPDAEVVPDPLSPNRPVVYPPGTVYQPLPDNTGVYSPGEESLDREFRDSAPRTEVLDSYGNLVNFDYTPAAMLRSSTGSGYNWTPPTVTGRPRSLMGADLLARYTGGRSAADLRQLTTGLGNGRTYYDYTGVLENPGSYGGGLSKSQLYSRMRALDYQRDAAAAALLNTENPEQEEQEYNPVGFDGYDANGNPYDWNQPSLTPRYDMGLAGDVTRPFAQGGPVKKA